MKNDKFDYVFKSLKIHDINFVKILTVNKSVYACSIMVSLRCKLIHTSKALVSVN